MKLRNASIEEIVDEAQFALGSRREIRARVALAIVRGVYRLARHVGLGVLRAANREGW